MNDTRSQTVGNLLDVPIHRLMDEISLNEARRISKEYVRRLHSQKKGIELDLAFATEKTSRRYKSPNQQSRHYG